MEARAARSKFMILLCLLASEAAFFDRFELLLRLGVSVLWLGWLRGEAFGGRAEEAERRLVSELWRRQVAFGRCGR
jgi:hypothetical protein